MQIALKQRQLKEHNHNDEKEFKDKLKRINSINPDDVQPILNEIKERIHLI